MLRAPVPVGQRVQQALRQINNVSNSSMILQIVQQQVTDKTDACDSHAQCTDEEDKGMERSPNSET